MRKTVIVTGAGGFVGLHLTKALLSEGFAVIAVDLNVKSLAIEDKSLTIVEADFTNKDSLRNIVDRVSSCYLVHLGGYVLGSSKEINKEAVGRSTDVNIYGSYNVANVLKPRLVGACLASTLDVYGMPQQLPITENHPISPATFYAVSKFAAENYVRIALEGKTPLSILRFSHIYGPGDPHLKVLPLLIRAVNAGINPVIYGDGSDLRDYINIKDIVAVIMKVIRQKTEGTFNVATGRSLSLRQLAEGAIKISGKKLSVDYKERRRERCDYLFDVSKLERELDFCARICVEEGIRELVSV